MHQALSDTVLATLDVGAQIASAGVNGNVIDMNGAVEMSVMPSSGPDRSSGAASDSK